MKPCHTGDYGKPFEEETLYDIDIRDIYELYPLY